MRTIGVVLQDKNNLSILLRHLESESNVRMVSSNSLGDDVIDAGFVNSIGDPLNCSEIFTDLKRIASKAKSCFYVPNLAA